MAILQIKNGGEKRICTTSDHWKSYIRLILREKTGMLLDMKQYLGNVIDSQKWVIMILLSFTYTIFQFVYLSLIRAYAYYIKLLQTYIEFCLGNDFCGIL